MRTTLKIKLCPTESQYQSLKETMQRFNQACNYISEIAFQHKLRSKFALQKLVYYDVKKKFSLTAQMVIRAISKVIEAYKRDSSILCKFKPFGAIIYDQRILSYKGLNIANLWTVDGRQNIQMVISGYQLGKMKRVKGQADLVLVDNIFYLLATMETPEEPKYIAEDKIGIDLGIVNIATDSTGEQFSGKQIENKRQKLLNLRSRLQSKGTKSAKRHLKKMSKKESRFRRDVNHCIAKKLVQKAKDSHSSLILENLQGLRKKDKRFRKSERAKHSSWSFNQLKQFITYKAVINGVPVIFVDCHNTSRECSVCGCIDKRNRKSQSEFKCIHCGHTENADVNAAKVIVSRAVVNQPIVVGVNNSQLQAPQFIAG
jgi:IS605 OrfB family transposase